MDDQIQKYKSALEALLFVSDKPITVDQFKAVFPELKPTEIQELVKKLQDEYVERVSGMMIVEIAGGWQMLSDSHAAVYIREFYKTKTKEKLSRPALESLAIIAYKQPVGRAEVEIIRGVNSDGTIAHLLNKGLVKIVGRKEVPGRPFLYGTTKEFLEYFGLRALEDLPKVEEFTQLGIDMPSQAPAQEEVSEAQEALVQSAQVIVEEVAVTQLATDLKQAMDEVDREAASQEISGQARLMQGSQSAEENE